MTAAKSLAKRYFELSNQRKLDDIKQLFTASSTYSSTNTGVYLGADNIMAMQSKFFAGFKTMHWEILCLDEVNPGVVYLDFIFTGQTTDGEAVERTGEEYVVVYNGKLQHVEVRNKA